MSLSRLIGGFVRRHWQSYASSAVMLVGVAICTVLIPRKVGAMVDALAANRLGQHDLLLGIAELVALGVAIYVLRVCWRIRLYSAAYNLGVELRTRLYARLAAQGPAFYQRQRTGDLMALATNDIDAIEMAAGEALLAAFDGTLTLVMVLGIMMLGVDWRLALVALLVAGVRFMGETAKILSPEKTILMPTLQAECSLDLGCPIDEFSAFCDAHPDRTVVVYANTSAAVKARADWVVTSSIAVELIEHLDSLGEKIIWAPDRHLGNYVQKQTGADVLCWQGACIVHDEFKTQSLARMKALYPQAAILVHPESPQAIVDMADAVGSTSQLIAAAKCLPNQQLIVATDRGIFYKMQQAVPEKELFEAPTAGEGATCRSCAHCPWMAMNGLKAIAEGLESGGAAHEIHVDAALREGALKPLNRMLDFAATLRP